MDRISPLVTPQTIVPTLILQLGPPSFFQVGREKEVDTVTTLR